MDNLGIGQTGKFAKCARKAFCLQNIARIAHVFLSI